MLLKIIHNVTKQEFEYTAFDISDSRIFYHFSVMLSGDEPEGEYAYYLFDDDGKIISHSMLQIGDYNPNKTVYVNKETKFKEYNG